MSGLIATARRSLRPRLIALSKCTSLTNPRALPALAPHHGHLEQRRGMKLLKMAIRPVNYRPRTKKKGTDVPERIPLKKYDRINHVRIVLEDKTVQVIDRVMPAASIARLVGPGNLLVRLRDDEIPERKREGKKEMEIKEATDVEAMKEETDEVERASADGGAMEESVGDATAQTAEPAEQDSTASDPAAADESASTQTEQLAKPSEQDRTAPDSATVDESEDKTTEQPAESAIDDFPNNASEQPAESGSHEPASEQENKLPTFAILPIRSQTNRLPQNAANQGKRLRRAKICFISRIDDDAMLHFWAAKWAVFQRNNLNVEVHIRPANYTDRETGKTFKPVGVRHLVDIFAESPHLWPSTVLPAMPAGTALLVPPFATDREVAWVMGRAGSDAHFRATSRGRMTSAESVMGKRVEVAVDVAGTTLEMEAKAKGRIGKIKREALRRTTQGMVGNAGRVKGMGDRDVVPGYIRWYTNVGKDGERVGPEQPKQVWQDKAGGGKEDRVWMGKGSTVGTRDRVLVDARPKLALKGTPERGAQIEAMKEMKKKGMSWGEVAEVHGIRERGRERNEQGAHKRARGEGARRGLGRYSGAISWKNVANSERELRGAGERWRQAGREPWRRDERGSHKQETQESGRTDARANQFSDRTFGRYGSEPWRSDKRAPVEAERAYGRTSRQDTHDSNRKPDTDRREGSEGLQQRFEKSGRKRENRIKPGSHTRLGNGGKARERMAIRALKSKRPARDLPSERPRRGTAEQRREEFPEKGPRRW